eukprot:6311533-Alexandrium_andersonii.AAC.1
MPRSDEQQQTKSATTSVQQLQKATEAAERHSCREHFSAASCNFLRSSPGGCRPLDPPTTASGAHQ